jgi:hypothetical protein
MTMRKEPLRRAHELRCAILAIGPPYCIVGMANSDPEQEP